MVADRKTPAFRWTRQTVLRLIFWTAVFGLSVFFIQRDALRRERLRLNDNGVASKLIEGRGLEVLRVKHRAIQLPTSTSLYGVTAVTSAKP